MLVYTPAGVAEEKEPIDARECIEHCGYTTSPPVAIKAAEAKVEAEGVKAVEVVAEVANEAEVKAEDKDQFETMSKEDMREYLISKGETPHSATGEGKLRDSCRRVAHNNQA